MENNIFEFIGKGKINNGVEYKSPKGNKGAYVGNTIRELHEAIDSDKRLEGDESLRNILKYGYYNEFDDGNYETKHCVIGNDLHTMWTVR